jgi:uncharacterized membrane protein
MKLVPLLPTILCWAAVLLLLARGCAAHRRLAVNAASCAFLAGLGAGRLLAGTLKGDLAPTIVKIGVGGSFILFWIIAATALYESTGRRGGGESPGARRAASAAFVLPGALLAGLLSGAICGFRCAGIDAGAAVFAILALIVLLLALLAPPLERRITPLFVVSPAALPAAVVALLLFASSFQLRLDLFSPLTMKVMKFAHDFVHQFFESMLIPDHLFVRASVWRYIGLLFGNGVGFWGGLIIWFTPVLLVIAAIMLEPLPAVAHIRQGAQRRTVMAADLRARRLRLVAPFMALALFGGAVYKSRFPNVEYWDPKPVAVTAGAAGEIAIPRRGEIELEDGRLHKYLFKQGGTEVRFFILRTPAGTLTAVLDACAICKPDGYGQAEGSVICYYCKTLIPIETVGKPGGCNPVPVPFSLAADSVRLDALTLVNAWRKTVQATTRVQEGGR